MKRLSTILISALLLAGCDTAPDDEPAEKPAGKIPARQIGQSSSETTPASDRAPTGNRAPADDDEPQTAIVRALLEAIDEVDGEDEDIKDELRRTLRESDKELRKILGGNSRRLIEQANKKPPAPMVVPGPNCKPKPKKATTAKERAT